MCGQFLKAGLQNCQPNRLNRDTKLIKPDSVSFIYLSFLTSILMGHKKSNIIQHLQLLELLTVLMY